MTTEAIACDLPRAVTLKDTPHTMIGDVARQRELITSLDLDRCNIAYIVMALNEYELQQLVDGKVGHRSHTWPEGVRARMEKEIERWVAESDGRVVRGFTQGVNGGCCVMAIHWRPKA